MNHEQLLIYNMREANVRHHISKAAIFCALLLVIGCQAPLTFNNTAPIPAGKGSFSLMLSHAGRTISPVAPSLEDFAIYTLVFTPASSYNGSALSTERNNANLSTDTILLDPGSYSLEVKAFRDANKSQLLARGALSNITISAGQNTPAVVVLEALLLSGNDGSGIGTFSWDISFPQDVASASMIIKSAIATGLINQTLSLTPAASGSRTLNSGRYNVTIKLTKTDGKSLEWSELLHVYQNLESRFTFDFTDDHFSDSSYTVTYNYNDGQTGNQTQSVLHGGTVSSPAVPAYGDYIFAGWYTDDGSFDSAWNFSNTVIEDITLYAKWLEVVSIAATYTQRTDIFISTPLDYLKAYLTVTAQYDDDTSKPLNAADYTLSGALTAGTSAVTVSYGGKTTTVNVINIRNRLTSVAEVETYLNGLSGAYGATADNPINLSVHQVVLDAIAPGYGGSNINNWTVLLSRIYSTNKFVNLDLSSCYINGVEFDTNSAATSGKNKIVSIILPNTVTRIKSGTSADPTFKSFTALKSFSGAGLTSIGDYAFYNCSSLMMSSLPAGLTSIGDYAFYGCTGLAPTSLPAGLSSIGSYAFTGCIGMALTSLPSTLSSIGEHAFRGCASLTLTSLPEGLTSIGNYAFYNCTSLAQINLPSTLVSIGNSAFSSCASLAQITLPEGLSSIGDYAFNGCARMALSSLPSTLVSIGSSAFSGCASLTLSSLPSTLVSIGSSAFSSCARLMQLTLPEGISSIGNNAFEYCVSLTQITLPSTLESIGNNVFYNCSSLTQITMPSTLESIGDNAFYNCTSLALTSLPDGLTSIGNNAFYCCNSLALTSLPAGLTSIGDYAFYCCNRLALTSLPDGITSIGSYTFCESTSLALSSLPAGLNSIGSYAFLNCTSLTLSSLPEGLSTIGNFAFGGCTGLTQITLPEGITSIPNSTFFNCRNLAQLTLPSTLVSIDNYAFANCNSLAKITCYAVTPPTLGTNVFSVNSSSGYISNRTLTVIKVPADSVTAYQTRANWSAYMSRISAIEE